MSLSIKAIVAGMAVVGVGGTGIWIIFQSGMPEYKTLDKDSGFTESTYQNKYAGKYTRFLVGVATPADSQKGNSAGWDGSFGNYRKEDAKQGFKDLERGAKKNGSTDGKSLQEVCESAYKADTNNVKQSASNTNEFEEAQVGALCSFNGKKPVTLSEVESKDGSKDKKDLNDESKGKGTNKGGTKFKTDLLAIHDSINTKIGDYLNKRFREEENKTGFFSGNDKSLKYKCEEAYGKESTANGTNNPSETDLYKGCSVKGSKTTAG